MLTGIKSSTNLIFELKNRIKFMGIYSVYTQRQKKNKTHIIVDPIGSLHCSESKSFAYQKSYYHNQKKKTKKTWKYPISN